MSNKIFSGIIEATGGAVVADSTGLRVLAVDDLEPVRTVIDRVLTRSGYRVDVAASLAEARGMDPGGYDLILVDAVLGEERGTDLIRELVATDPAAAGRCLLVTGSAPSDAPPGVARLEKPFRLDGLLSAVRALRQADPADLAAPRAAGAAAPGPAPAISGASGAGAQSSASRPAVFQLLALVRRLRTAERVATANYVHDGPIQELTAAMLSVQVAARDAGGDHARQLGRLERQLEAAAGSLRGLIESESEPGPGVADLGGALHRQAAWLPFSHVSLDVHPTAAAGSPGRDSLITELIELALFALADHLEGGRAEVTVRGGEQAVEIELRLSQADGSPVETLDMATAVRSVTNLAHALGGTAHAIRDGRGWRATITVPVDT